MTTEINLDDFFGQAKSDNDNRFKYQNFSLKEGEPNIFRIAPPVNGLKATGRWSIYDKLHYGYTVANPEDPAHPRHRPFRCIENRDRATGMLKQDCPECTRIENQKKELDSIEKAKIADGMSAEEAAEAMKGARKLARTFNLDSKHYVLAKNLAGEWGVLKIPHKAMQAIKKIVDQYQKENQGKHPFDASGGVWLRFTRKGTGFHTEHFVDIENEALGGGKFQYKPAALTALDAEAISKCPDLATLNDNRNLTYDQINALVKSGGDPLIVAQVLGQTKRPNATPPAPIRVVKSDNTTVVPPPNPKVDDVALDSNGNPAMMTEDDEEALLLAKLAAARAKKLAQTPPERFQAPEPRQVAAAVTQVAKLDPHAFLAKFPDPNKKQ